ncbi:MAG: phosphatidylserine decarboxylase family protein, partial [Pseudonocardiales bacterium]|nr:phosphatidylserine decarboxylase family protein [Pseudonocardiales bacterium]
MHRGGRSFVLGSAVATLLLRKTSRRGGVIGA